MTNILYVYVADAPDLLITDLVIGFLFCRALVIDFPCYDVLEIVSVIIIIIFIFLPLVLRSQGSLKID